MRPVIFRNTLSGNLDLVGTYLSLACAIHCIALPLLVVVLPLVGLSFFLNHTVEKVFVVASILLAAFNLCWGYTVHKKIRALLMFPAAAAMIISGMFVLPHHHHLGNETHDHGDHPFPVENVHSMHLESGNIKNKDAMGTRPQDDPLGLLLLVCGATAIAISHLLNRHLCKSCKNCNQALHTHTKN